MEITWDELSKITQYRRRPYHVPAFSGGKDSVVLKWLLDQASIPYQARVCRYCYSEYKERNSCPKEGHVLTLTGVRKAKAPRGETVQELRPVRHTKGVTFFHPIP